MKAAIFVRVTTQRQDYTHQINELKQEAARQELEIVKIIKEKESGTAKREARNGIAELLELARTKQIQKVLTLEVSRLVRSTGNNLRLLDELTDLGVSNFCTGCRYGYSTEWKAYNGSRNPFCSIFLPGRAGA